MATKKTAPAALPDQDLVQLRAVEPIRADGVDYAPGEALELDAAAAKDLLASGAAELA